MVVRAPCFTSSRAFSAASCSCKASASACRPLSAVPRSYAAAYIVVGGGAGKQEESVLSRGENSTNMPERVSVKD